MIFLKVGPKNIFQISRIASLSLKRGQVLICPTDTVYGLIANAKDKKAVRKLLLIKKRWDKALPVFIKDLKAAKKLAKINKNQEIFLKKFWPGKVTAVLQKRSRIKIFDGGQNKIGLRVPNNVLINNILKITNLPLIGTSANISGQESSYKIKEVVKQFEKQKIKPDLVLDAGNLKKSKTSTVIDLTLKNIKVIRKGAVKIHEKES